MQTIKNAGQEHNVPPIRADREARRQAARQAYEARYDEIEKWSRDPSPRDGRAAGLFVTGMLVVILLGAATNWQVGFAAACVFAAPLALCGPTTRRLIMLYAYCGACFACAYGVHSFLGMALSGWHPVLRELFVAVTVILVIIAFLCGLLKLFRGCPDSATSEWYKRHGRHDWDTIDKWETMKAAIEHREPFAFVLRSFASEEPESEVVEVHDFGVYSKGSNVDSRAASEIRKGLLPASCFTARNPRDPIHMCCFQTVLLDPDDWLEDLEWCLSQSSLIVVHLQCPSIGLDKEIELLLRNGWVNRCWLVMDPDKPYVEPAYRELIETARWVTKIHAMSRSDDLMVEVPSEVMEVLKAGRTLPT